MAILTIREALGQAMAEEMRSDDSIFLMGEEVAEYNGAYKVSKGLLEEFGPQRVIDSPISENGFAGLGVGAAMAGLRPIIEMMTWNFGIQAFDQIVNHAAKMYYMSGGQFNIPMVFRGPNGAAHMLSSQHSQALEPMLTNVPGLIVCGGGTPYDCKGLLKSAIRNNNPVIFLESEMMYSFKGEVPEEEYTIPLGKADIKREGSDITLVGWNKRIHDCLKIADRMQEEDGVSVEVIDMLTLQPLDEECLLQSVQKTNRIVIYEESHGFASVGSHIASRVSKIAFDYLDAPCEVISSEFVPMPYAEHLEHEILPSIDKGIAAVKQTLYH